MLEEESYKWLLEAFEWLGGDASRLHWEYEKALNNGIDPGINNDSTEMIAAWFVNN